MREKQRRIGSGGAVVGGGSGRAGAWVRRGAAACLVAGLWSGIGPEASSAPGPSPDEPTRPSSGPVQAPRAAASRRPTARVSPSGGLIPSDDWTFRPTVVVRRGTSQGSGTIIASVDGETLVLTAAHVVRETGPIAVELHRYNLGLERTHAPPGAWPQPVDAEPAAIDAAADLAILRIEGLAALPYVARLAAPRREPAIDAIVTSIGIDPGTHLSSWSSRLVEVLWFELNDTRDERLFFITARPPEHGRSGGGLFLPDGELVGVCVGHTELVRGRRLGVFASQESIYRLLLAHDLDAVIYRSERHRSRLGGRPAASADSGSRDERIRHPQSTLLEGAHP
jgi:S1-C subfamily serine protease